MPKLRTVRAAAVQLSPSFDSLEATFAKVLDAMKEAAEHKADLVVFPEAILPYYPYFAYLTAPADGAEAHLRLYDQAVLLPGHLTDTIGALASELNLVTAIGITERDHAALYSTQLIFDADGALALRRRKTITTKHEQLVWTQGDANGLKVVESCVGRVGSLACWEHFNPLARYALMAQHEHIHCAHFPGGRLAPIGAGQMEASICNHALESGCFVVCASGWLSPEQLDRLSPPGNLAQKPMAGGSMTAIIGPDGRHLADPLTSGEGLVVADLALAEILERKRLVDNVRHPDLSLQIRDRTAAAATATSTPPATIGRSAPEPLSSLDFELADLL